MTLAGVEQYTGEVRRVEANAMIVDELTLEETSKEFTSET